MNSRRLSQFARLLVLSVPLSVLPSACHKAPKPDVMTAVTVPVVVRDDSASLMFTWIDEKGEAHIETKASDVPIIGRDTVRVVDPDHEDPADAIYVADLRQARPDGTYAVHTETRVAFDALIEERRKKNGLTLSGVPAPAPSASAAPDGMQAVAASTEVIIYGAEWCHACHEAADYLHKKGIRYVEKDIEKDANAAREMQAKLAKTGQHGGSIPVLDVRGHVMVGFNPQSVEGALRGG